MNPKEPEKVKEVGGVEDPEGLLIINRQEKEAEKQGPKVAPEKVELIWSGSFPCSREAILQ